MIEIKNLSYRKNGAVILENINMQIQQGSITAIIGPNGAGKSTLIKIILNLLEGYDGQVIIDGEVNSEWLNKNNIGYLPQLEQFDRNFPATVKDIVLMGLAGDCKLLRAFSKEDKNKAEQAMEFVDALHLKNNYIGSLSGGEYQRVLLARAIVGASEYLLLDEPEAGVDRKHVIDLFDLFVELNKKGKTIILVSHDINIITQYSTHLVCLNKTLHSHTKTEVCPYDVIQKTYGGMVEVFKHEHNHAHNHNHNH